MIKKKFSLKKSKILITIIIIVFAIFLLNAFQKEVRSLFYSISAPIQKVFWREGNRTANFLKGIFNVGDLRSRADQLETENKQLLSQLVNSNELKKENETLRQSLGLELQKDFKLSFVQIIGKNISQDYVLINKGAQDGIMKDMPVITNEKILVGRISDVYDNFSKVMLISNGDSILNASVQREENNIVGIIKGKEGFDISFDLVSNEETIFRGDIVITNYLDKAFPGNLLIGMIKNVYKSDVESFQWAEVEPFFNLFTTEDLFVILEF